MRWRRRAIAKPAQWLTARLAAVPTALQVRIRDAIDADPCDTGLIECLRGAAQKLLDEYRGDGSRDDAITLLAADALVTYACEAAAEQAPALLAELR